MPRDEEVLDLDAPTPTRAFAVERRGWTTGRIWLAIGAFALAVIVLAAVILRPQARFEPEVVGLQSEPTTVWTSELGVPWLSPIGDDRIAVFTPEGNSRVVEAATGRELWAVEQDRSATPSEELLSWLSDLPGTRYVASMYGTDRAVLFDRDSGEERHRFTVPGVKDGDFAFLWSGTGGSLLVATIVGSGTFSPRTLITRLDPNDPNERLWTVELPLGRFVNHNTPVLEEYGLMFLPSEFGDNTYRHVIWADSGEVVDWMLSGGELALLGLVGVIASPSGVRAVDVRSGAELWRGEPVHGSGLVVDGDALYMLPAENLGHLVRVDPTDGTEIWRAERVFSASTLTTVGRHVYIADRGELIVLDRATGREVARTPVGSDTVQAWAGDGVLVTAAHPSALMDELVLQGWGPDGAPLWSLTKDGEYWPVVAGKHLMLLQESTLSVLR